jgi:RNA-directed DNA polymerase
MTGTSSPKSVSTKLQQVAEQSKRAPQMIWTTLAHQIDKEWLKEAYRRTRKDGAVGVDSQTAAEYAANLEVNLEDLLNRFKSGTYRAPPVRRVYIPKGDGKKRRPIGIPTFEDKVLQRAVAMVLEAVYEQDFLNCSYGFRPGRSAHALLASLWQDLMSIGGGWVIDLDIQSFFDEVKGEHLRTFLDQRVRDGVLRRTIDKWLKAGVLEQGNIRYPEAGTPQGGVISPLLANIYLHEVLDTWFKSDVKSRLQGQAFMVRYADDAVLCFEREEDARRVMAVLPKRFGRYGLTLHPEKTRLLDFRRPGGKAPRPGSDRPPGPKSFDLLGFTHFWGRSRRGKPVIKRKTSTSRFSQALKRVKLWCRRHRHDKVADQRAKLTSKLRGHYAYYGITGNGRALVRFRYEVCLVWRRWLGRRSDRDHMPWNRFLRLLKRYPLPPVKVVNSIYQVAASP